MNDELIKKYKLRSETLKNSIAKVKGVLEMDKDKPTGQIFHKAG